jgi:hypothetical protein
MNEADLSVFSVDSIVLVGIGRSVVLVVGISRWWFGMVSNEFVPVYGRLY